jgi:hypothetical protein
MRLHFVQFARRAALVIVGAAASVVGARADEVFAISLSMLLLTGAEARSDNAVETVAFVRHGEKPEKGLGQLSCQGLNRALALPSVIIKTFGRPDAIFAPDPHKRIEGYGEEPFDYIRALATIEPTAISFGLPVDASIGVSDVEGLLATLERPQYKDALILIAWEHEKIEAATRALLAAHGADVAVVPEWHGKDFDSIYVVTLSSIGDTKKATFTVMRQGLDGQKETCPQ